LPDSSGTIENLESIHGKNIWSIYAKDKAGNFSEKSVPFYIDSTLTRIDQKGLVKNLKDFQLNQNYPNPFNISTNIQFVIPKASHVTLKIYNISGENIATLVDKNLSAKKYSFRWDATNFASGLYLYRIQVNNFVKTKKLILLK